MRQGTNAQGGKVWDIEAGDVVRLYIEKGVRLEVRRLNKALDVRSMPGGICIIPLDSMRVLVETNHEDLKGIMGKGDEG